MTKEENLKQIVKEKETTINALTKLYEKEREINLKLEKDVRLYKSLVKNFLRLFNKNALEDLNELLKHTELIYGIKENLLND